MEIFKHLPLLNGKKASKQSKFDEAVAKEQRIKFHREQVRNGPVKFKQATNGQIRRARQREAARDAKRARKNQLSTYFAERQESAVIRAMLTGAGIIATERPLSAERARDAIIWISQRFAEAPGGLEHVVVDEDLVTNALNEAIARFNHLTGSKIRIPEDYVLPVRFAA